MLPRSNGDFRLGAENLREEAGYEEMVDIPLDRLLEIGYDDLHANQATFKAAAAKIDPKKTPQQVLADWKRPSRARQAAATLSRRCVELRDFIMRTRS